MIKHKLPSNVEGCLIAALRQLTDPTRMTDKIRKALIEDQNVKIYLDTWVKANLTQIVEWNNNMLKNDSITVMGGRYNRSGF